MCPFEYTYVFVWPDGEEQLTSPNRQTDHRKRTRSRQRKRTIRFRDVEGEGEGRVHMGIAFIHPILIRCVEGACSCTEDQITLLHYPLLSLTIPHYASLSHRCTLPPSFKVWRYFKEMLGLGPSHDRVDKARIVGGSSSASQLVFSVTRGPSTFKLVRKLQDVVVLHDTLQSTRGEAVHVPALRLDSVPPTQRRKTVQAWFNSLLKVPELACSPELLRLFPVRSPALLSVSLSVCLCLCLFKLTVFLSLFASLCPSAFLCSCAVTVRYLPP